jgi:hypothetical protein
VDYVNFLARHRVPGSPVARRRARRSLPFDEVRGSGRSSPARDTITPPGCSPSCSVQSSRHVSRTSPFFHLFVAQSHGRDGLQHRRLHRDRHGTGHRCCVLPVLFRAQKPALGARSALLHGNSCRSRRRIRPHDRRCRPDGYSTDAEEMEISRHAAGGALSASEGGIPIESCFSSPRTVRFARQQPKSPVRG